MRSDALRRIVPAALLAVSFPVLLAGLLDLTVPLWLPLLLAVLSAGTVAALAESRRPWLPALCWAVLCAAALLVQGSTLTGGLAALVNAALRVWQQVFPRVYPAFTASADDTALTALLAVLSALWGLWSARCTLRPRPLPLCLTALPLAAAAVVLAPAAPLWWMALAALTLLFLHLLAFGREGRAALRVWCRAAVVVLLAVTVLDGWSGDAARPGWLDDGKAAVSAGADTLRYGNNAAAGLPGGDLTAAAPARTEQPMLTVTMTVPASYYLRGFVGETYADGRWTPLDSASLAESADTFYWLHRDGFRPLTQLTSAARAAAPELLDTVNTVTVENTGASSKYLYAPYELGYDTPVPIENAVGEASLAASGLRGQRTYTLSAAGNILIRYRRIGASLAEDTAANAAFLDTESAYNRFAYDHYTDVSDDIRRFLTEKLSGWEKEPDQTHFDCQRAKQNILFYLSTYVTYTETASAPPAGTDPILYFLDGVQTGGDAQYAAAAAMMFRYYGIPARCVEGFLVTKDAAASMTPGQPLTLTGQSGHTWVEYYQDGVGWLPFEVAPPYLSVMEQAESYQNVSGLVGQAPPDTEDNEEPDVPDSDLAQTLREFWLKHRLTILLTLSCILAAAAVCLFTGWLICQRKKTARRKARFADPHVPTAIDAIYRYTMDVLRAEGLSAANCAPADYAPFLDEDLREEYRAVAALWEQARFGAAPMDESQRRRALALEEQVWTRTWRRAKPGEKLRLKYKEFL